MEPICARVVGLKMATWLFIPTPSRSIVLRSFETMTMPKLSGRSSRLPGNWCDLVRSPHRLPVHHTAISFSDSRKLAELSERRIFHPFCGQRRNPSSSLLSERSVAFSCRASKTANLPGCRASCACSQSRSGHSCICMWQVSGALPPGVSWHFSRRSSSSG